MKKKIGVIVYLPPTPEAQEKLDKKMSYALADVIINTINKAPAKYKNQLFETVLESVENGTY